MKNLYIKVKYKLNASDNIFVDLAFKYKKLIKYLISGGTAAFTDLFLLWLLHGRLHFEVISSATLAFLLAFFVSFFMQKFWTFSDDEKEGMYKQMSSYLGVAIINLGINALGMHVLVKNLGVMYILSQIIMSGLIAMSSFFIYNMFIFNRNKNKEAKKGVQDNIRILIATGIFPPDIGGPATMGAALAEALQRYSFSVRVLTYANERRRKKDKIRVRRIIRGNKIFSFLNYFFNMLFLSFWADVVYVTDIYSVGYFAYLIKKMTGKKYIVRFAGDSAWETAVNYGWTSDYILDFQTKKYDDKIEKLKKRRQKIMAKADRVIAVSNFLANIAVLIGVKKENVVMIYNSIDFLPEAFDTIEIEKIRNQFGDREKIIITACRLVPWKGSDGLIRSLPGLINKIGSIKLLILGDGNELENLKELAKKLNVENNVVFLGRIEHEKALLYYASADLFVLNSNYEGLPHVLLEVMKIGVPIASSRSGGNPEVIEDEKSGLLFNYNNIEEIVKAEERILSDKAFAQNLVINAKEKLKIFDWRKNIEATVKLIKEVYE